MTETNETTQPSSPDGSQQSTAPTPGEGFRKAEELLTTGNQGGDARDRSAFSSLENRETPDEQTGDIDSMKRQVTDDQRTNATTADAAVNKKVSEGLDDKALEESVEAAKDTSRTVMDLTPHNT
jgi:hypothetical protein